MKIINLNDRQLPKGWEICHLPNFTHIEMGQSPPSSTYNKEKIGLPFFQGKAEFTELSPKIEKYCSEPKKIAKVGATLLTVRAPVGPTNLADVKCCIGRGLAGIHPLGKIDPKFILFLMRSIENEISNKGTGSTFTAINKAFLEDLNFALPPTNEQKRIVAKIEELFSELDKGIEHLKTAREQLRIYRQAVLKNAFEGKLTEKWREENQDKLKATDKLLSNIENSKAFDSRELKDLPEIPNLWGYTRLSNTGELGRGKSKHRPRNDKRLFGGNYPFLQTGEVKAANGIIKEYAQTYSEFGLKQSKLWPKGTLCITIAANIAETAFLGFDACFPDSVVGFTAQENTIHLKYVDLFIQSVRARVEGYAPATAQKNINLTTLENLIIPICSLTEQQKIVEEINSKFSVIDKLEKDIEENLRQSQSLRQSILKKAFAGELVEQDPNDEPASVLLDRIRLEKDTQKSKKKSPKSRRKLI